MSDQDPKGSIKITIVLVGVTSQEADTAINALGPGARLLAQVLACEASFCAEGASVQAGRDYIAKMKANAEAQGAHDAGPEHDALASLIGRDECPPSQAN